MIFGFFYVLFFGNLIPGQQADFMGLAQMNMLAYSRITLFSGQPGLA